MLATNNSLGDIMPYIENQSCPVCSELFKAGDDIVYCPTCGTPCHRKCYEKIGECPNKSLHATGFIYGQTTNYDIQAETPNSGQQTLEPKTGDNEDTMKCPKCGATIRKGSMFCTNCGALQDQNLTGNEPKKRNPFIPTPASKYERSTENIDSVPIADAACVVGNNCDKFIPKFLKNKKANWNWGAFIFGSYYFYYRKMTVQGLLIMAVNLIVQMVTFTFFSDKISALTEMMSGVSTTEDLMSLYSSADFMSAAEKLVPAYIIILATMLIIHIFCGIFSDYLYRKKVVNIVRKTDEKLDDGNALVVNTAVIPEGQYDPHEIRRMFLAKKGGVSILWPIVAFIILRLIVSFLGI